MRIRLKPLQEVILNAITRLRGERYIAKQYKQMHAEESFIGHTWQTNIEHFEQCVPGLESKTILDFGCGPRGGIAEKYGANVISHDPYVEKYAVGPWARSFDVVFSSDVFEHMRLKEIAAFTEHVRQSNTQYVYLIISIRTALKRLPNGANAHLTVRSSHWWLRHLRKLLGEQFEPIVAEESLTRKTVTLCFHRESTALNSMCKAA